MSQSPADLSAYTVHAMLQAQLCEHRDMVCRVGDGDCGTTLAQGAQAIKADCSQQYPLNDAADCINALAVSVGDSMGGSSGALYQIYFVAIAGKQCMMSHGCLLCPYACNLPFTPAICPAYHLSHAGYAKLTASRCRSWDCFERLCLTAWILNPCQILQLTSKTSLNICVLSSQFSIYKGRPVGIGQQHSSLSELSDLVCLLQPHCRRMPALQS